MEDQDVTGYLPANPYLTNIHLSLGRKNLTTNRIQMSTQLLKSNPTKVWGLTAVILFALSMVLNYGSLLIQPVQDRGEGQIRTLVNPAGYAFSIWTLIFFAILWASWRIFKYAGPPSQALYRATVALVFAAIANCLWVPVSFGGNQLLIMLDLMANVLPLAIAYCYLVDFLADAPKSYRSLLWPVSVFMGWTSVATIVTIASFLQILGYNPDVLIAMTWAVALTVVVLLLGLFFLYKNDIAFPLTLAWALVALAVQHWWVEPLGYVYVSASVLMVVAIAYQRFVMKRAIR